MELLSIPSSATGNSSTKVLVLDGTTAKFRTAQQIRIDGGGASTSHGATHSSNGTDPVEISQAQVFDTLQLEDGSFLLAENGNKLSIQGVDDIRDLINAVKTVSASDAILGRKSPGSGFFEELTISDALDFIGATARGDIIYRGADGWDRLPAGTAGQFLRTQGTTGDPTWATVAVSVSDGDKGDITVSNSGSTWTIDNDVVTYAKIQNVSANKVLGRSVTGPGDIQEIDCTAAGRAIIGAADAASQRSILELLPIATTGSASDLGTGTVPAARFPALTGDVTSAAGTVNTTIVANAVTSSKIANSNVTYAKIQNVTASKILGRKTNSNGDVEECSLSEVLDLVGSAAQGDILYRSATGWTRLGAGTPNHFLKTNGPNSNPSWAAVSGGTASKQADFSVLPYPGISQLGDVYNTLNNEAFPSPGNSPIFRTEFVPTNFTVSLWCFNGTVAAAASGQCGVKLQYSTSSNNTGWQDVPNSTVDVLNQSGAFLFSTSTVSIPNSPSAVYWRLVWVSTLLDSATPTPNVVYGVFVGHSVMIRLWS